MNEFFKSKDTIMQLPQMESIKKQIVYNFPFIIIFILFLGSRLLMLQNVILLEDHDSVSYLITIEVFITYSLKSIYNLDPDSSIFYPFLGAIFSLPGWSVETGARLATVFSQCVLFIAILGIGLRLGSRAGTMVGLILFTLSPAFIELGVSVLTEPTYVALVYLGIFILFAHLYDPKLWKIAAAGSLFGLAFLTRVEGLVFIAVIPFILGVHYIWKRPHQISIREYAKWGLVFIAVFSIFAIPQIYRVSDQMDTLALNGRQAWTLLLHSHEGETSAEILYSLDYSKEQVNIAYVKQNMREFLHLDTGGSQNYLREYAQTFIINYFDLEKNRLPAFFGSIILVFFAFGLFKLYRDNYRFELLMILLLLTVFLVPPMLHNVVIRHILIIGPFVLLIAGYGIAYVSQSLLENRKKIRGLDYIIPGIFIIASLAPLSLQLKNVYNPPKVNHEYSIEQLQEPLEVIRQITETEFEHRPKIAARKIYLPYYAQSDVEVVPFADYDNLIYYLNVNNVDFVYLHHYLLRHFPFMEKFRYGDISDDFTLLYQGEDVRTGEKIELYRFFR